MNTAKKIHLTGIAAIECAEQLDLVLRKYADPTEGARDSLSVAQAREIATEDPSLIYLLEDDVIFRAESIDTEDLRHGDLYRELQGSGDQVLVGSRDTDGRCLESLLRDTSPHASRTIFCQIGEGEDAHPVRVSESPFGA